MEISFEKKVATAIKKSHSVKELIENTCDLAKDNIAIKVNGEKIELYSQKTSGDASVIGADAVMAIAATINEIKRLQKHGLVLVYQINQNNSVILGDHKIIKSENIGYQITNSEIAIYAKLEIYGGQQLDDYIERGYLTEDQYASQKNLTLCERNLKVARISMVTSILVGVATFLLQIICKC